MFAPRKLIVFIVLSISILKAYDYEAEYDFPESASIVSHIITNVEGVSLKIRNNWIITDEPQATVPETLNIGPLFESRNI